jgi:heme/copper-type cytochrome/quinol oxidase subunit 4
MNFDRLAKIGTFFVGFCLAVSFGILTAFLVKTSWPGHNSYFVFGVAAAIALSLWMMMYDHIDELAQKFKSEEKAAAHSTSSPPAQEIKHPHWP